MSGPSGGSSAAVHGARRKTGLLGQTKPIPQMAAARMQRWMLMLLAYRYKWVYRKGEQVANADALSRLPLRNEADKSDYVHFFSAVQAAPLSADKIREETQRDAVLSKVLFFVLNGWPAKSSDDNMAPFFVRKDELSVDCGCVTWGNRVVIPKALQAEVLQLLHEGHPGVTRMKMLSRSHVWWPKLTTCIEEAVKGCSTCQLTQNAAPKIQGLSWGWPTRRWQRVHLDFAYYKNEWFLVLVDAYSKWVDVQYMKSTTAANTVETLRTVFAAFGLPEKIVTDNGPQFVSDEFSNFLRTNAVQHTRTPPYHPASNGAAERLVQTVKRSLLRQFRDEESTGVTRTIRHRLDQFLFVYRNTPCPTTGKTPAELFLSWKPRTRLSILHPELAKRTERGITQGQSRPNGISWREFEAGDSVRVRGTRPGDPKWLEGTVVRRVSLSTYIVRVQSQERFVHVDDITSHAFAIPAPRTIRIPEETSTQQPPDPALAVQPQVEDETGTPLATPVSTEDEVATENNAPVPQLRRSSRTRKQPERYGFETK
ncbi:uncharacterized protein K02A2.6-like isoform X3 [Ornithodoros turicata]|uniref:uncharacterized protein K02A2.6-like isoform X3 n=1 Tax=Ornithodoros turicata TaxID=34597 RepID=UPI003139B8BF